MLLSVFTVSVATDVEIH